MPSSKKKKSCPHNKGWTFKQVKDGVKRTCRVPGCKFSITEIGRNVRAVVVTPMRGGKRKKYESEVR